MNPVDEQPVPSTPVRPVFRVTSSWNLFLPGNRLKTTVCCFAIRQHSSEAVPTSTEMLAFTFLWLGRSCDQGQPCKLEPIDV
ncbi:hypothetical protein CRM22_003654 [Opisthorchis felineus]|uniref:Uncharacterized protein n=1 Tax=Opisthorchis felineus TaxID=147828 RepID=A0A4S2M587_OPIFE|nr:hypothetical protein CRM22_003654 [Opisthorchis felineus]